MICSRNAFALPRCPFVHACPFRLGRQFVIAGADRLVYLIQWHPVGFKVQRLDHEDALTCMMFMLPSELHVHGLDEALRSGQLFTLPVNL